MRKKRVLIDSDGVMSDLLSPVLDVINKASGSEFTHQDVHEYNICEGLGVPHMVTVMRDACATPGFVHKMPEVPFAREGVLVLREIADVFAVTTPMSVPTWAYERELWLKERMGFTKDRIVQTEAKHVIVGDVLIDDKVENVLEWAKHHPEGLGIIFHAPYNKNYNPEVTNISRAWGWSDVLALCQNHLREK